MPSRKTVSRRESLPRDSPAERGPVKNLFKEFTEEKHDGDAYYSSWCDPYHALQIRRHLSFLLRQYLLLGSRPSCLYLRN